MSAAGLRVNDMRYFLIFYILTAAAVITAVFFLSLNENKSPKIKTILTAVYVLALVGVLLGMTVLEEKYRFSRLASSAIAAAMVGLMYLADTAASKIRKNREE